MTLKGKQLKLSNLAKSFSPDPDVLQYINGNKLADNAVWYKSVLGDNKTYFMLQPFLNNYWTEDKIAFVTFKQIQDFCDYLNIKLEIIHD